MSLKQLVQDSETLLEKAGFDFDCPDPRLAWKVFKEFAVLPIASTEVKDADRLSINVAFLHLADRDEELWFDFARDLSYMCDGRAEFGATSIGYILTNTVPEELIGINKVLRSKDFKALHEFLEAVETCTEFQLCLQLPNWTWRRTLYSWLFDENHQGDE